MRWVIRVLAYVWALPTTSVGLAAAGLALATGGKARWVMGVIEVHGGFATWALMRVVPMKGGATAMTLGHVVIGRDVEGLEWSRAHERIHVKQCECWGPFFFPAYLGASAICWLRGKDAYRDNPFEVEAYSKS